jgi:hypothetical protein
MRQTVSRSRPNLRSPRYCRDWQRDLLRRKYPLRAQPGDRERLFQHDPIEMAGGTTFHFVTDGFDAAFARASEAAGDRGVEIAGGASTVRQALGAGVIDELVLDFVPSCSASASASSTASLTPASSRWR